jgi:hypothetical protein
VTLPTHVGLWFLALFAVLGFACVIFGFWRLVRAGLELKKRLDAYADLPLRIDIALAQRRIALAERRIETVPVLVARADRAYRQIDLARQRVLLTGATLLRAITRPLRRREPGEVR